MWLITHIGVFGVTQRPADQKSNTLTLSARLEADLVALRKCYLPGLGKVTVDPIDQKTFRARADRDAVAQAMANMVQGLEYADFTAHVAKAQGEVRANLYQDVSLVLDHIVTVNSTSNQGESQSRYARPHG
ncbi:MAG: hypothetical protein QM527_01220 [Alphaproteobacteria bacterium]|nr:hypothetical protein [Alphaproteobacteria bacterium]MDI9329938.1 hypothetical protein [Alphaproteobacteria bacterium]